MRYLHFGSRRWMNVEKNEINENGKSMDIL